MSNTAVQDAFRPKLGKSAEADLTVDGTVRKNAAGLQPGDYKIVSTVDAFAIQVVKAVWDASLPTAALLRAQGTPLPANVEVDFRVRVSEPANPADGFDVTTGDGYLIIVKSASAADGTARILASSVPVTAVLS